MTRSTIAWRASTPGPTTTWSSPSRCASCSRACARSCAASRRRPSACASPTSRDVWRGERRIELTRTEYGLLELFLAHPRQVLTRSQIFEQVWGYDFGATSNALGVYVGYLRRKTEAAGEPRLLHTVRGVGYVLRDQP